MKLSEILTDVGKTETDAKDEPLLEVDTNLIVEKAAEAYKIVPEDEKKDSPEDDKNENL